MPCGFRQSPNTRNENPVDTAAQNPCVIRVAGKYQDAHESKPSVEAVSDLVEQASFHFLPCFVLPTRLLSW